MKVDPSRTLFMFLIVMYVTFNNNMPGNNSIELLSSLLHYYAEKVSPVGFLLVSVKGIDAREKWQI